VSTLRTRILLAEDHQVVREGLHALLAGQAEMEVVGEAADGAEAVRLAEERGPDVIVMDLTMPGIDGVDAIRRLRRSRPDIPVVVLSMHDDAPTVDRALHAGARGYVLKGRGIGCLCDAIRAVRRGEVYLSSGISDFELQGYLKQGGEVDPLSERERAVLKLIAEGCTGAAIAERLGLSPKTVEHHRAHITEKLGIRTTAGSSATRCARGSWPEASTASLVVAEASTASLVVAEGTPPPPPGDFSRCPGARTLRDQRQEVPLRNPLCSKIAAALLAACLVPLPATAQRAGGYQGLAPEPPPASQPAPAYETVVQASPLWTQQREFLGTRFWKLDQGHSEAEVWWRPQFYREGPSDHLLQAEMEIGLTRRLQLDIYENLQYTAGPDGVRTFSHEGNQIELRIAIPERYGTMWGNPVIYLEWHPRHDAPDRAEARLLLGGELFTPRLMGALNLVFEANADRITGQGYQGEPELGVTGAASYEVIMRRLRLGAEAQLIFARAAFRNSSTETELLLGPNVAWLVLGDHLKIFATLFFGVTEEAPRFAPYVILASGF
jgi:DNA-binding NarL/FixJ family response regulator